jgi:hypothetical protein
VVAGDFIGRQPEVWIAGDPEKRQLFEEKIGRKGREKGREGEKKGRKRKVSHYTDTHFYILSRVSV